MNPPINQEAFFVFHQAALGDFILIFPLLRRLAPAVIVAPRGKALLAARVISGVEAIDIEQRQFTLLHGEDGAEMMGELLRRRLATAAGIVSFVSDGGDYWARNMRRLAPRTPLYCLSPRPAPAWNSHVTAWHEHQLQQLGLSLPAAIPIARRFNADGPIIIHPGSGGRDKCWPVDRYAALAQRLHRRGPIRCILGEVEAEQPPEDFSALNPEIISTLDALRDILETARLYIGNDAGPTHLAAQLGVPTVAIFGPTPPQVWRPLGPNVQVVAPPQPGPVQTIALDHVLAACHADG